MPGYDVTTVEPAKESFYCPHCRGLLRQPIQNQEGYRLCQECCDLIRRLPEGKCEDCGMTILPDSEVYPDKAARREIDSLVVYCANRDMGCDWTGRLASLDTHTTACPHKGVTCPNEGCGQVTAVAKMDLHLVECPFRLVECDYCHSMLPFCQLPVSVK
jgi:hypothetical protein